MNEFTLDASTTSWVSTFFMWNFGLVGKCDHGAPSQPAECFFDLTFEKTRYANIKAGDKVWVPCHFLPEFYNTILPDVKAPFVLIVIGWDESFPDEVTPFMDVEGLIHHKHIIKIFAQNCTYQGSSKKVSPLPLGLDFHNIGYILPKTHWGDLGGFLRKELFLHNMLPNALCLENGNPLEQEKLLSEIIEQSTPTHLRKLKIFVDFQYNDSMRNGFFKRHLQFGEDRTSIFKQLIATNLVDYSPPLKRTSLWEKKTQYAFSVSPHGNGLDCHRTWEDLALGCIVIVKTSPLDALYEGLPVVIVKDWNEITEDNLNKWALKFGDALTNINYRTKLTTAYWWNKINAASLFSRG